ncbi:MAG: hypothetical protein HC886_07865 [Leptolyngbyaceae cyanobacterium SM1_1_3]|nr:hypothetical protein [Leptolyngbyaceae cyanobacterium SM1_1_3]NJN01219.1 hypothetical protein [Leptolyngbyaceae cyanobacterium RM1_1_2]NJO09061.1 hypothetical protein [Leptolyngbyaceae cyanobacterium SL_1_1]
MSDIQSQIEQERERARAACEEAGSDSSECAVAWDTVEELQAEASHQRSNKKKTSFEEYCDNNPDADECRIYDN